MRRQLVLTARQLRWWTWTLRVYLAILAVGALAAIIALSNGEVGSVGVFVLISVPTAAMTYLTWRTAKRRSEQHNG